MDLQVIGGLLQPFLTNSVLSEGQLQQLSSYLDLLLRWNTRVNLTSVRQPEEIVTRHFGESLFAAQHLFSFPSRAQTRSSERLIDLGSGAGFPGLPIKIWMPDLEITLIESNQKKATFLREVIRKLGLSDAAIFPGRAEDFENRAETVTLRAVERFEKSILVAARLVAANGRLALLVGEAQVEQAIKAVTRFEWSVAIHIPLSANRVLLVGTATHPHRNQID